MVSASKDGAFLAAHPRTVRGAAGARLLQPARAAGVAGTDHLGRARLRPGHHPRRPARSALRRAGRRHVAGATDRAADRPGLLSLELEESAQELGPFSNPPALSRCVPSGGRGVAGAPRTRATPNAKPCAANSRSVCARSPRTNRAPKGGSRGSNPDGASAGSVAGLARPAHSRLEKSDRYSSLRRTTFSTYFRVPGKPICSTNAAALVSATPLFQRST